MSKNNGSQRRTISPIEARRESQIEEARSERLGILMAVHATEARITAPAPGREGEWKNQIARAVGVLRASLNQASERGESAGGLIAELKTEGGIYYHRVVRLQQEFEELIRRCNATLDHLSFQGENEAADFADIRQRIAWLLTSLKHHQAREADLVYEAHGYDVGIGE